MEVKEHIFVVVGFPFDYVKRDEWLYENEKAFHEAYKNKDKKKIKLLKEERKEYAKNNRAVGPCTLAFFKEKEEAIDAILKYPDTFHDCYHDYILVEKHHMNIVDSCEWWTEVNHTWFKYDYDKQEFVKCDKPEMYKQTTGFAN